MSRLDTNILLISTTSNYLPWTQICNGKIICLRTLWPVNLNKSEKLVRNTSARVASIVAHHDELLTQ